MSRSRASHVSTTGLFALAYLLLVSCGAPPPEQTVEVDVAGCDALLPPEPRCRPGDDGRLTLWLPATDNASLHLEGASLLDRTSVQQGQRLQVEIEPGSPHLRLRVDDGAVRRGWELALVPSSKAPWVTEMERLRAAGQDLEAEAFLRRELQAADLPDERGTQLYRLAGLVRRRGEAEPARQLLAESMAWFQDQKRYLEAVRSGTALSYWLHLDDLWSEERQVLDRLERAPSVSAEADFLLHFFIGQLAFHTGDLRTTQRRLQAASQQAERLGLDRFQHQAQQVLAQAWTRGGQWDRGEALFQRLADNVDTQSGDCEQAIFFNNLGWNRLLTREGGFEGPDPLPALRQAEDLVGHCDDVDPGRGQRERANIATNLALAHLHAGDLDAAEAALQRARATFPHPERKVLLWWKEIDARLALQRGDTETALRHFAEESELAADGVYARAAWRAAVGTARTLWTSGRTSEALAAFQRAESLLDSEALSLPIGDDRSTFVARRQWASSLYLEALLEMSEDRLAMDTARRARSRILRSLWRGQRLAHLSAEDRAAWNDVMARYHTVRGELEDTLKDAWQLPGDQLQVLESRQAVLRAQLTTLLDQAFQIVATDLDRSHTLRPPDAQEALLVFHPAADGWLGFGQLGERILTASLQVQLGAPGSELSARLLSPFSELLDDAAAIRILPYGALRDIDFHALPYRGEPLVVHRRVVYGLDLPATDAAPPSLGSALMVIDPNDNLPSTAQETIALEGALQRHAIEAVHWLRGSVADGDAVRRALPQVDLFHFAGHGEFDGWESALLLADASRLQVADILALPQVPPRVILSGCETGRSGAEGLHRLEDAAGLGAAFLTAGSQEVIATQRPVEDDLAADLMSGLYAHWDLGDDAAEALRQTQIAQWRQDRSSDWASFRAIEP